MTLDVAALLAPLPRPTWPHLLTTWSGGPEGRRRRCSCGADPAEPGCVDYAVASRLLLQAVTLIRSTGPAARQSLMPAACLTPAARRARGLAYLALVVAAGQSEATGPADAAAGSAVPSTGQADTLTVPVATPDTTPGQSEATGPVAGRDVRGTSWPASPAFPPDTPGRAARLDPVAAAEPTGPAPHTCIVWTSPPLCGACHRRHARRGLDRPQLCADPAWTPVPVCTVCTYTLDPVAAAEFGGRHPECALPVVEREHYRATLRELGQARRAPRRRDAA